jgi:hypothetical protein
MSGFIKGVPKNKYIDTSSKNDEDNTIMVNNILNGPSTS